MRAEMPRQLLERSSRRRGSSASLARTRRPRRVLADARARSSVAARARSPQGLARRPGGVRARDAHRARLDEAWRSASGRRVARYHGDPLHDPARSRRSSVSVVYTFLRLVVSRIRPEARVRIGVAGWTDPSLLGAGRVLSRPMRRRRKRVCATTRRGISLVEVDATYYALPTRSMAAAWAARNAGGLHVRHQGARAHDRTRHRGAPIAADGSRRALPQRLRRCVARVTRASCRQRSSTSCGERFLDALEPLRSAGKLGAVTPAVSTDGSSRRARARTRFDDARSRLGDDVRRRGVSAPCVGWTGASPTRTFALLRRSRARVRDRRRAAGNGEQRAADGGRHVDLRLAVVRLHGRRGGDVGGDGTTSVTERYRYLYDERKLAHMD